MNLQFVAHLQIFPPLPRPLAIVQTVISVLYLIRKKKKKKKGELFIRGFSPYEAVDRLLLLFRGTKYELLT